MYYIPVILGSVRRNRETVKVARFVLDLMKDLPCVTAELLDLKSLNLPMMEERLRFRDDPPPALSEFSGRISRADAIVIVTPEYNSGYPGVLKNALDYLHDEWHNKVVGFVSYGSAGGVRAVEQLRLVFAELEVATVRAQVFLPLATEFENYRAFKPTAGKAEQLDRVLGQVLSWGAAFKSLRERSTGSS